MITTSFNINALNELSLGAIRNSHYQYEGEEHSFFAFDSKNQARVIQEDLFDASNLAKDLRASIN